MKCFTIFALMMSMGYLVPSSLLALDRQTTSQRIDQLEKMSKVERDRLNRNIQEFAALSRDDQAHYRDLHDKLISDRIQQGGTMFSLLQTYSLWVHTLSPSQQDELQRETDIAKKLALVRRFKEEQEHHFKDDRDSANETHDATKVESGPDARQRISAKNYLVEKRDLDAMMKVIIDDLPPSKKEPDFEPLQVYQYTKIITAHVQWKDNNTGWPDEDLMKKMTKVVTPSTARVVANSSVRGETKRETIVRLILMGILKQADDLVRKLTDDEKEKIFAELNADEQARVNKFETSRRREYLRRKYFESKGDDSYKKLQECRLKVMELFERLEVPLPEMLERLKQGRNRQLQSKG